MKKIGIVTLNHGYNYGNKLQNYAIKKIYENMENEVETIAFKPIKSDDCTTKSNLKGKKIEKIKQKFIRKVKQKLYANHEKNRIEKFKRFNKEYLNMSKNEYNSKNYNLINENEYSLFSVGSDQVWNSYLWDFSKFYLLDFVKDNSKKIAYAASFAVDSIKDEYKKDFIENLQKFRAISVREENGIDIIQNLINTTPKLVLDPTMLLDKQEWEDFIKVPQKVQKEKYIFTYFLGEKSSETQKTIKRLAKLYKLKIIDMNNIKNAYFASSPNEFLYLLKNSEIVLTDSFHACVFSIIFNKSFYVFDRNSEGKKMNSRIDTLLKKFNLTDRKKIDISNKEIFNIDYSYAKSVLRKDRDESLNFIKNVVEE